MRSSIPLEERAELYRLAVERGLFAAAPRTRSVLLWWSRGYGTKAIATRLGISRSTVRTLLDSALERLAREFSEASD